MRFVKGDRNKGFPLGKTSGMTAAAFDAVIDMCAHNGSQTKLALSELKFSLFIHFSTSAVYEKSETFPLTEESPLGDWPLWGEYNKGKRECEEILASSGIRYASIRPVYILGPKNYCDRERFIYARIKYGLPISLPGNGQALIQFVFADEVAGAITFLAERGIEGVFNCAGNEAITLKGLTEEMGKIVGRRPILEFNPEADGARFDISEFPFANENLVVSNEKIKGLGITFTPLLEGLKRDYENYYRNVI